MTGVAAFGTMAISALAMGMVLGHVAGLAYERYVARRVSYTRALAAWEKAWRNPR